MGMGDLRISHLRSPIGHTASADNSLHELLDICRPLSDPFDFQAHGEGATCAFPFERTDFIGADAFSQPDSPSHRDRFAQALL
jgi:hypothetical protein